MAAVTREFSQFGTVFVKIRRDEKTGLMPFAFCQFTVSCFSKPARAPLPFLTSLQNRQDADNALVHGRGIYIHGRPCRTERAKSSREWHLIIPPSWFGKRLTIIARLVRHLSSRWKPLVPRRSSQRHAAVWPS